MMTDKEMNTGKWITAAASLLAFMGIGVVDPLLPSIAESIGGISLASRNVIHRLYFYYGDYDDSDWYCCRKAWR